MIAEAPRPVTPDPLAGVLVALHLQGISIRRDDERLIARPAEGQQLDADTTALIRQSKSALLEHLALSEPERRAALLGAYESVLWEVGRQVQAGQVPLSGWLAALAKYEAISLEAL